MLEIGDRKPYKLSGKTLEELGRMLFFFVQEQGRELGLEELPVVVPGDPYVRAFCPLGKADAQHICGFIWLKEDGGNVLFTKEPRLSAGVETVRFNQFLSAFLQHLVDVGVTIMSA